MQSNGSNGTTEPPDDLYDEAIRNERIVLQIASGGGDDLEYAAQRLEPEHFRTDLHRRVWAEFLKARSTGDPPNTLALIPELVREGFEPASVNAACEWGDEAQLATLRSHQLRFGISAMLADSARRQRKQLAASLMSGTPQIEPEELGERIRELTETERGTRTENPMLTRIKTGAQLASGEPDPVASLVGDGLLVRSSLALLAGHSGLGKTYLSMQLMRSLAAGSDFLGFACQPCRVGLLELEMPERGIRNRLLKFARPDSAWLDNCVFLCIPDRHVNLLDPGTQDWIVEMAREHRLDVLICDPLNRLHGLDENKAGDVSRVLEAVLSVRNRSGACILLVHHVNKRPQEPSAGTRTSVLESMRGSTRLGNDPDLVMGMLEAPGRLVKLVFAKTRYCEDVDPLYLSREPSGIFAVTAAPEDRSQRSKDRIEKYLLLNGPSSAQDMTSVLKMSTRHIKRLCEVMGLHEDESTPTKYSLGQYHMDIRT